MKIRKKQWILMGVAVFFVAATATAVGVVRYTRANRFDLMVNGHKISRDEYIQCMQSVEYDTEMQIQKEYGIGYTEDFWEKEYDGRYGYEILAENTVEQLKYIHVVYDVAEDCGDITDGSYEALEKRWKDENRERSEKLARGEVVYGLKEYTFPLFLQYEISMFKEAYCNDNTRQGMDLTEEEILEHYNSREWIFSNSEDNADLETARIAVERELREKKYDDMIQQKKDDSLVDGDMEDVGRFTLKNI